jgi:hypothetical protein
MAATIQTETYRAAGKAVSTSDTEVREISMTARVMADVQIQSGIKMKIPAALLIETGIMTKIRLQAGAMKECSPDADKGSAMHLTVIQKKVTTLIHAGAAISTANRTGIALKDEKEEILLAGVSQIQSGEAA